MAGGLTMFCGGSVGAEECLGCHEVSSGMSVFHNPRAIGCTVCHLGDPQAVEEATAHLGLEAFPGRMETLEETCGRSVCHADVAQAVQESAMHRLDGMLAVTRRVLGGPRQGGLRLELHERLQEVGVDSYLRKLCVSCHLGSPRVSHTQTLRDRGGGCAACHLHPQTPEAAHPRLSVQVRDSSCFGCHSRSGRISLNYVGLAETDSVALNERDRYGRLPDGRVVERLAPDVHAQAGMECTDCHTRIGTMGTGVRGEKQLDIQCEDCHGSELVMRPFSRLLVEDQRLLALRPQWIPPEPESPVVVTRRYGTALPQLRLDESSGEPPKVSLSLKASGKALPIPRPSPEDHPPPGHERLSCDACHASWAPQCYGCHIGFDAQGVQFDHLRRELTPGRWVESRWAVQHGPPALGVDAENRIRPFVPGMNLTLELPGQPLKHRFLHAPLSPHTTGRQARSCASCHADESALGVAKEWGTAPQNSQWRTPLGWLADGLPDPGASSQPGARSFNAEERKRIQQVVLPQTSP